jgi:membrane protease YdiL (CAAX protease family)
MRREKRRGKITLFAPLGMPRAQSEFGEAKVWYHTPFLILSILLALGPMAYVQIAIARGHVARNSLWFFIVVPYLCLFLMAAVVAVAMWFPLSPSFTLVWVGMRRRATLLSTIGLSAAVLALGQVLSSLFDGGHALVRPALLSPPFETVFMIALVFRQILVSPFVEEVFWRGYVQTYFQRIMKEPMAVIVQALVFAAIHVQDLSRTLTLFLFGVTLGIWRWRKGTLVPLIVAHVAWNSAWWVQYWHVHSELQKIDRKYDYRPDLKDVVNPMHIPQCENAWPEYERAFALFVEPSSELSVPDLQMWPKDLSSGKLDALRAWIAANEQAFGAVERGGSKTYCLRDYTSMPFQEIVAVPSGRRAVSLSYALLASAKTGFIEDRHHQAVSDIVTCYRFGQHFMGPKPINEIGVGLLVQRQATRAAIQIVAHARAEESFLIAFRKALLIAYETAPVLVDFSGQRIVIQEVIQGLFMDDGEGDGRMPKAVVNELLTFPSYSRHGRKALEQLRRKQTIHLLDEVFAYLDSIRGCTPIEIYSPGVSLGDQISRIAHENPVLMENMARFEPYYHQAHRNKAATDGLVVAIDILRYCLKKGHPPDELRELVEEQYLDALPSDPFSGVSLVYRRTTDDFVLYSLGPDFRDDGGSRSSDADDEVGGDDLLWPIQTY